jgi:hypothetical protein
MDLLKELIWSDDKCVIKGSLMEIAEIGRGFNYSGGIDLREENEVKIRVLGVHTVIFEVLQKHVGCLEIQREGIRALANFSRLKPTKKLLGDIGCVEVIIVRMEKYPASEILQFLGCVIVGILVKTLKGNAERVEQSGGIAVVIVAMKAHRNSELLQRCGCRTLLYMSEWEEYRPLIVKAGGLSAISSIMETDWYRPGLQDLGRKTLKKLIKKPL